VVVREPWAALLRRAAAADARGRVVGLYMNLPVCVATSAAGVLTCADEGGFAAQAESRSSPEGSGAALEKAIVSGGGGGGAAEWDMFGR